MTLYIRIFILQNFVAWERLFFFTKEIHIHSNWQPLIDRIKSRLSGWKSRNLSLGGCLVLLKSVLSSLPVYFLSFFKAPAGIISSIEFIFNCFFFWGVVRRLGKFLGLIETLFFPKRRREV